MVWNCDGVLEILMFPIDVTVPGLYVTVDVGLWNDEVSVRL